LARHFDQTQGKAWSQSINTLYAYKIVEVSLVYFLCSAISRI